MSQVVAQLAKGDHAAACLQPTARTVLFCKNSLVSIGLKHILADTTFVVSGVASDPPSLQHCCSVAAPDLFIVDGSDASSALETISYLKAEFPQARVAVIGEGLDLAFVRLGCEAGADGFCLSTSGREVLIGSLELILLGEAVVPSALVPAMFKGVSRRIHSEPQLGLDRSDPRIGRLSSRETEILGCLTEGASNKVIARKLDVAEATVKVHVKAILRKIGAANRTQAAMWATGNLPTGVAASHPH
ncbi:LuxR C-terminal-related transcriptional regulator [Microvirga roseola]|uniref:LuxR C-terminal-related transcriptional regulator n=1 Tax=Microvirga roseola TaxID=2883126 RepID=UPI001E612137|nr:response regulator transcription factor [Microvirga roseola]